MGLRVPRHSFRPPSFASRNPPRSTLFIGGAARFDVLSGDRLLLTVWAAPGVVTHYGKTETAERLYAQHAGGLLKPPSSEAGVAALGPLVPRTVRVEGDDLNRSTTDVAIAGLGWVGIGISGSAELRVHTPARIQVTTRESLIPDQARDWARPGFGEETRRMQKK